MDVHRKGLSVPAACAAFNVIRLYGLPTEADYTPTMKIGLTKT
jgi:hypothetical protein